MSCFECTTRRLEVTTAKLVQELPQRKRDGDTVSRAISDSLIFDESKSTAASVGLLRSLEFLPEIAKKLKEGGEDEVRKDLEEFRQISKFETMVRRQTCLESRTDFIFHSLPVRLVTRPENIRVAVAGDILQIDQPRSAWKANFRSLPVGHLLPLHSARSGNPSDA